VAEAEITEAGVMMAPTTTGALVLMEWAEQALKQLEGANQS
jgi:hypothetical protein